MTKHFFASFCQGSKCNLHVSAAGENTHHMIEAIFKAFAVLFGVLSGKTGGNTFVKRNDLSMFFDCLNFDKLSDSG